LPLRNIQKTGAPRIWVRRGIVHYEWWPSEIQGAITIRGQPRSDQIWWLDLVRVGHPNFRGKGYGTKALQGFVKFLIEFLGAKEIGLAPRSLGAPQPWLRDWYQREGFTVEHEDGSLWMMIEF